MRSAKNENSQPVVSTQPKLKDIDIPEFDGDISKFYNWNWKALFVSLVHDNPKYIYSETEKMFYPKKALVVMRP